MEEKKKRKYEFKKDKKWRKFKTYILILLVAVLGVVCISSGIKIYFSQKNENKTSNALLKEEDKYGVITSEAVLYKNPSMDSEVVTNVVGGEEFNFVTFTSFDGDDGNPYYLISYEDSEGNINIGYVNVTNVQIVAREKINNDKNSEKIEKPDEIKVYELEQEKSNEEIATEEEANEETSTEDGSSSSEIENYGKEKYTVDQRKKPAQGIEVKEVKIKMANTSITM